MIKAVLLSGGIESILLTYDVKPDIAITVDYGQKSANSEIKSSKYICNKLNILHKIIKVNLSLDELTYYEENKEWIPFRNQFLITIVAMNLFKYKIKELYIGSILDDNKFMDNRKDFINAINQLLEYQEGKIKVIAPYIDKSILNIIKTTNIPLNIISVAHSCTDSNIPCGKCQSCLKNATVIYTLRNRN